VSVSAPEPSAGLDPHPLIEAVFGALDDDGAGWCVLRGIDDLHAPAGDVDLLIAPGDAPRLAAAAAAAGFARWPARRRGSHVFYVAYDAAGDRWLKLDAVSELAFGPDFTLPSSAGPECLRRRRRRGAVAVLDDADAFWSLLLHRLLDKGAIGAAAPELRRLATAPNAAASPLAREVDAVAGAGCAAALVDAARRGAWAELDERGARLAETWARQRRAAVLRRRLRGRLGAVASARVRWRRGMTVAMLGSSDASRDALARSLRLPVPVVAVGGGRASAKAAIQRARGRVVLMDARRRPAPEIALIVDPARGSNGLDNTRRTVTAAIWDAYRRRW
jgi:hypothetical protein